MATDIKNSALATNLVAYWTLDEASGTRVDSHGSNDLTDNNTVTSATGIINNGAYFTAANTEYLSRADGGAGGDLDPTGDYSVSFWFDRATTGSGEQFLYGKDRLSGAGDNRAYSAYLNSSNQLEVFYRDGSGNNTGWQSTSTSIGTDAALHHLVITVDVSDTSAGIKCYLDGNTTPLAGSYYATSATSIRDSAQPFHLAVGSNGSTYKYNGLIDEFGFWKGRILSTSDVTDLYNSGAGLPYVGSTDYPLTADLGTFTLTGIATALLIGRAMVAALGTFALTGVTNILSFGRVMATTVGTFILTGIDAIFYYGKMLIAAVGEFTLTGINTAVTSTRTMVSGTGSFILNGIDILFSIGRNIIATVGEFTFTGVSVTLSYGRSILAETATFTLTGINILFSVAISLLVGVGSFVLTGINVLLTKTGWTPKASNTTTWAERDDNSTTWTPKGRS